MKLPCVPMGPQEGFMAYVNFMPPPLATPNFFSFASWGWWRLPSWVGPLAGQLAEVASRQGIRRQISELMNIEHAGLAESDW